MLLIASRRDALALLLLVTLFAATTPSCDAQWGRGFMAGGGGSPVSDLYADLGVARRASKKEIKKRFRTLAKQHHPDTAIRADMSEQESEQVKENFAKILRAYNILADDQKRALYDEQGIIEGENDAHLRQQQHQQHHFHHGFGHFFNQRRPPPIESAAPHLSPDAFRRVIGPRRGRRIAIVQFYHDDCVSCRVFAPAWEVVVKGPWAHVVDFFRVDVASADGQEVLGLAGGMAYPPAPLVASVLDGAGWPFDGLHGSISQRNPQAAVHAMEKFIDSHYTDFRKYVLEHGIRRSTGEEVAAWVRRAAARWGDARVRVVFPHTTDHRTVLAVATNFANVDLAVAPGGMPQLRQFMEQFPGTKLLTPNKHPGASVGTQKDAIIVVNVTATASKGKHDDAAAAAADGAVWRGVHCITSGSRLNVKRVLQFVKESLQGPPPSDEANRHGRPPPHARAGAEGGGGGGVASSSSRRASDAPPVPTWSLAAYRACAAERKLCLVAISTKASCDDVAFLPEWADPVTTISPFEIFSLCAGTKDPVPRRIWELLKRRRDAFVADTPSLELSDVPRVTLAAFNGEVPGEFALFRREIHGKHDTELHEFLAGFVEGTRVSRLTRREREELEQRMALVRPFHAQQAASGASSQAPSANGSGGGGLLAAARAALLGDLESPDAFPVSRPTRLLWYVGHAYAHVPLANLLPLLGMFLFFKLLAQLDAAPRGAGRRAGGEGGGPAGGGARPSPPSPSQHRASEGKTNPQAQPAHRRSAASSPSSSSQSSRDAIRCPVTRLPFLQKHEFEVGAGMAPFLVVALPTPGEPSAAALCSSEVVHAALLHDRRLMVRAAHPTHRRWWSMLQTLTEERDRAAAGAGAAAAAGRVQFIAMRTSRKAVGLKPSDVAVSEWLWGLLEGRFALTKPLAAVRGDDGDSGGAAFGGS